MIKYMFCAGNKTYTYSFATKKKAQAGRYRLKSDQNATKLTVIYFVRLKPDWMWLRKSVGYNWQPAFAPIEWVGQQSQAYRGTRRKGSLQAVERAWINGCRGAETVVNSEQGELVARARGGESAQEGAQRG